MEDEKRRIDEVGMEKCKTEAENRSRKQKDKTKFHGKERRKQTEDKSG
jgi:hypothetical protein